MNDAGNKNNGIVVGVAMISVALLVFYGAGPYFTKTSSHPAPQKAGAVLPIIWNDLGKRMVRAGVIDAPRFEALYAERGGLPQDAKALLDSPWNGRITITPENAGIILNLLWAAGLGNKNPILENGPMRDPRYGGAGNMASTGGWMLARGDAMAHYGAHRFVELTPEQQMRAETAAKHIHRPCCGNSTYFPDCNHGMAMLGILELMASQGASESEMYRAALAANSYWFPGNYLTIARYLQGKGIDWKKSDPKDILAADVSSAQGYAQIVAQMQPAEGRSAGGCGA